MERQLERRAIEVPLQQLFDLLLASIEASNQGLVLPTADELNERVPKVRIKDEPMFGEKT